MSLITVNNLTKNFEQGEIVVRALRGVSLNIEENEFTALVGPSGSGKTTLLNIIGALDKPTTGDVVLSQKNIADLSQKELAGFRLFNIGFVFQAYNLIPVMTAVENIEYVLMLQKVDKKERREKAISLMSEMKMEELANRFPRELSGGQQQRVAVARALVSEPKVVLADEPTANLDSENTELLLDIMAEMSGKKNTTFLFSTHDSRVMNRARRLVHLRDGQIEKE